MKSATFNNNFDAVFAVCQKALALLASTIQTADKKNKTITGTTDTFFFLMGRKHSSKLRGK